MTVQQALENGIDQLVSEFIETPYIFFTEADAVARFQQILEQEASFNQRVKTQDGYEVSLIHREYPTFFRFSDKKPEKGETSSGSRGHYDTVILNPDFVAAHPAETVQNRSIKTPRDERIVPFQAVVEFKLDNRGWSAGRAKGAIAELGKLRLSEEAPLRYFVVLMRYCAPKSTRWEKYWPKVEAAAKKNMEIGSIFAIRWLTIKEGEKEVYRFGRWLQQE